MSFLSGGRVFTTSAATTFRGIFNAITRRIDRGQASIGVGDVAPDFVLDGSDGRKYRLSDFRGRSAVVLAWFPAAFTGGCTAQCRSVERSRNTLQAFDVALFGASVDDPRTNREFAAALALGFPILSDPDLTVARAYGVLAASGLTARWTFYIGLDGRVIAVDRQGTTAGHGSSIEDTLVRLGLPVKADPQALPRPALTS